MRQVKRTLGGLRTLLVRHAQTEWNADGRWQGWSDVPLSSAGLGQAEVAAEVVAKLAPSAIVCSDLRRAIQTAEVLQRKLPRIAVFVEPDLREFDVGEWQGLTRAQIDARWPGSLESWWRGELAAVPGGELRAVFIERVTRALSRLERFGPSPVLVVTHGGVIGALAVEARLPYAPVPALSGRWCEIGAGGTAVGDVVDLLPRAGNPNMT